MYSVRFDDTLNSNRIILSVVKDAGHAFIMPWMPIPVSQIVLTELVSGTSTDIAKVPFGTVPNPKHLALTVEGTVAKLYFRGKLIATAILSTPMEINRVELVGGSQKTLLSEMVLVPSVSSQETIAMWNNLRAPFHDPSPVIPDSQIPSSGKWDQAVTDASKALADAKDAKVTADGKARTFFQDTPPVASGIGDIWFDTSDYNHRYWWDGSKWADVSDTSPVDASRRPITAQGLGGTIHFDQHGYRAVRKADGKVMQHFDLETGSNYWEGDGVFRGRVEASEGYFHGEVKSIDADGNYSVLDQARLRFYRRIGNEDVLSYYVAQIATGQAVDGQIVDLGAMGYRFFEPPKVVLQPKLNRVFVANTTAQDVWMDWDVLDETFDPSTGAATFMVRCRTIIKGTQSSGTFSPSRLEQSGNSMLVSSTTPGTVYFDFRAQGYAHAQYIWESAKLTFHVDYRPIGGSWIRVDTRSFSSAKSLEFDQKFTYNVPSSGAIAYQVRVLLSELSDWIPSGETRVPHLTLSEFTYRSEDTILSDPNNPEVVSWIAIDGG